MCLSKTVKYLVCPSKLTVEVSVWEVQFFPVQRKLYILFSISFLIFWKSINLAYVSQFGNNDLASDYIFTSQKESHSVPHMGFFLLTFNYFIPFGAIENSFTKLTSSILMEIVTVPVVLVHEFCFYMYHPIKAWLFEKILFELVYLFHIVLKSLVS